MVFVDTTGEREVITGEVGDEYDVTSYIKDILGYTYFTSSKNEKGRMQLETTYVVFYYAKNGHVLVDYLEKDTGEI